MNTRALFTSRLQGTAAATAWLQEHVDEVAAIAETAVSRLKAGGTIYTAGNGGSAAQALHLAEELIGRYRGNRRSLRAVCLNADPTALTCIANDFGFDQVFARQCEALLTPLDLLIVLSTSGNSPNIVNALRAATKVGATTIGLLGRDGGSSRSLCTQALIVPLTDSAHIQEAHETVLHLICEAAEQSI